MKKFRIFLGLVLAFMFSLAYTSCEELEGLEGGETNESSDSQAYFPKEYAQKTVAAWYELTEKKDNGTKTEAVFLFDDGTFVTTKSKVYTDGRGPERVVLAAGSYRMTSGDYTNGTAQVAFIGEDGKMETMTVEIKDGKMSAMDEVFTKQDNAKLPKASDPQGEGGDQGNALEPFFPTDYANKTIKAWYKYSDVLKVKDNDHPEEPGYDLDFTAAFYFFDDNTFISTTHTLLHGPYGNDMDQRLYSYIGKYEILEGDFNNGKIKIYIDADKFVTIEIKNGQLMAAEAVVDGEQVIVLYDKQDNSKLPDASEPTEEYIPGGEDGGDEDEALAFFPTTFAKKEVVAWYTYTAIAPGETQVEAVFLFDDNTLAVTSYKIHPEDQVNPEERYILAYGTYKLSGTFDNGSAESFVYPGEATISVTISNGNMTLNDNSSMVYIKRDLDDIPSPLEPTGGYIPELEGNEQGGDGSIYGTWVYDLADPYGSLILEENGIGTMNDLNFKFTYENGILTYDGESKFKVTIEGDVMTWAYIEEDGGETPTGEVWFRSNGTFDKTVSTGRWDGFMGEEATAHGVVYIFNGNEVDIYIIAWGEQLKGSFTHEGGVINFELREGYNARIGDAESWSWEAGNLDAETLQITEGYSWWKMDEDTFNQRKEELAKFTFALVSDVKAYGGLFGRSMVIEKAK